VEVSLLTLGRAVSDGMAAAALAQLATLNKSRLAVRVVAGVRDCARRPIAADCLAHFFHVLFFRIRRTTSILDIKGEPHAWSLASENSFVEGLDGAS
jgi:hypothetical protein